MGSKHKKEREKNIQSLVDQIRTLETLHKQSLSVQTMEKLLTSPSAWSLYPHDKALRGEFKRVGDMAWRELIHSIPMGLH